MCLGGVLYGYCCDQWGTQRLTLLPLIGASSTVKIIDSVAQVELKQRYENQDSSPIEAIYEYPLPEDAAVTSFTIEVDGKVINAKIKEKEQAQQIYDDAIAEGHGAYMLEQLSETTFQTSVGNLPAGKAVLITIVYVQKLEYEDGALEFVMPTTQNAPNGRGTTKLFEKPKYDTFDSVVPYGVKVQATIQSRSPIVSLTSPSHAAESTIPLTYQGQHTATAGIHITTGAPLTQHWILRMKLDKEHEPSARVQVVDEKQSVAMVSFYPEINEDDAHCEIVFVVDRSGSMAGNKMKRVKETLDLFLRSLPEGTWFNIVSFGTKFEKKFPKSVRYNEANFKEATEYVKKMFANMYGTNIIEPLKAVFSDPLIEGVPRQIFLLTDGEVNNRDECIDTVKKYAKATRVFTFGIGEADGTLVREMAKAGNGRHEFISDNNDMEDKVMRHLSHALKPALIEPKLDWGSLNVLNTAPYHCPPLFAGSHIVFYGFVPANTSGTHQVTFTAKGPKGKYSTSVSINFDEKAEGNFISKLAARLMIDDLETGHSSMHTDSGNLSAKFTQKDVSNAIIRLSLSNQVMSKLTAFIAVEKRREATTGTMHSVKVNNNSNNHYGGLPLKSGYGGGAPMELLGIVDGFTPPLTGGPGGARRSSLTLGSTNSGPPMAPSSSSNLMDFQFLQQQSSQPQQQRQQSLSRNGSFSSSPSTSSFAPKMAQENGYGVPYEDLNQLHISLPSKPAVNPADKETVRSVIQQQSFSGSFDLQALNSLAPKVKLDKVREVLKQCNIAVSAKTEAAAVTLMVVVLFELKFSELKSMWDLVAKKAKNWAKKELGGIDIVPLETAAKTHLSTVV